MCESQSKSGSLAAWLHKQRTEFNLSSRLAISSEHRLRSENLSFDIDVWYPCVAHLSFPTVFRPFRKREAEAMVNYYALRFLHRKHALSTEDVSVLRALEKDFDVTVNSTAKLRENGAFIRLCGRSPKDGEPLPKARRQLWEDYSSAVATLEASLSPSVDDSHSFSETEMKSSDEKLGTQQISAKKSIDKKRYGAFQTEGNLQMNAMSLIGGKHLRCRSGRDVMNQLLTSERVYTDLHDWLLHGEPEQVAFRNFCVEMRLDREWRVFVFNGRVTAISQYDHYTVYPQLLDDALLRDIRDDICEFMEETRLCAIVGEPNFIVDILWLPQKLEGSCEPMAHDCGGNWTRVSSGNELILIELSPFRSTCTGASMFNWKHDDAILKGERLKSAQLLKKGKGIGSAKHSGCDDASAIAVGGVNGDELKERYSDVVIKVKRESHPQIGEMVEANWTQRWNPAISEPLADAIADDDNYVIDPSAFCDTKTPYWYYFERAVLREEVPVAAGNSGILAKASFVSGKWNRYNWLSLLIPPIGVLWYYYQSTLPMAEPSTVTQVISGKSHEWWQSFSRFSRSIHVQPFALAYLCWSLFMASSLFCFVTWRKFAVKRKLKEEFPHLLFVYGTLKRGFHWNKKYLTHGSTFIGKAVTSEKHALVLGDCCVPYLLHLTDCSHPLLSDEENVRELQSRMNRIKGELWRINDETLRALDDYEGVDKGYYSRPQVDVRLVADGTVVSGCFLYSLCLKTQSEERIEALLRKPFLDKYKLTTHRKKYSAIKHIQVKQLAYLSEDSSRH